MRKILSCVAMIAMVVLGWSAQSATPVKKKAPAKKSGTKSAAPAKKKPASSKKGKKAPTKRTTWRNRQLAPTPERYTEIQNALVAKGCLQPEDAGGGWNQASVEALKKFQAGQNLEPTGKINSLSLIALGLGPKREITPAEVPVLPSR